MGQSATAHVAYGYDLGGEYEGWEIEDVPAYLEGEDEDFDGLDDLLKERLLARSGFTEPAPHEYSRETPWTDEQRADMRAWHERKDAATNKTIEADLYGTYDYGGTALVVTRSLLRANWGVEVVKDERHFESQASWDEELSDALHLLGIKPNQAEPKWLVYPMYG